MEMPHHFPSEQDITVDGHRIQNILCHVFLEMEDIPGRP